MYAGSISKQGLLSTCCLGYASLGACAFAGEFAKIAPPMISAAPIRRTGVMTSPKRTAENTTAESGSR